MLEREAAGPQTKVLSLTIEMADIFSGSSTIDEGSPVNATTKYTNHWEDMMEEAVEKPIRNAQCR